MIKNSRQASVSKKTREELLHAAEQAPPDRRVSFLALAEEISRDLEEYEAIQAGELNLFNVESIDQLGECLIKARLAKGWTHRQLAEALQVSEQMVQRDEAQSYEHAGLARIAEVADALGYSLTGKLQPSYLPEQMWRPLVAPLSMAVDIHFKAIATWVHSAYRVPANLTTGPLSTVGAIGFGSSPGTLPSYWAGGTTPANLFASQIVGAAFGTDAFDSAVSAPLQLTGDKP